PLFGSCGWSALDAPALLIPRRGFLPPGDERVRGTVRAMERLRHGGFVRRYTPDGDGDDAEGAFVSCSLWYADALAATGRTGQAREAVERVLGSRNDVGLLAEQSDPGTGRQLGNAPQAFSHLALVNTAFALSPAPHPAPRTGPAPAGP